MTSGPPQRSRHAIFIPVEVSCLLTYFDALENPQIGTVSALRALADDHPWVLLELDALVGALANKAWAAPVVEAERRLAEDIRRRQSWADRFATDSTTSTSRSGPGDPAAASKRTAHGLDRVGRVRGHLGRPEGLVRPGEPRGARRGRARGQNRRRQPPSVPTAIGTMEPD